MLVAAGLVAAWMRYVFIVSGLRTRNVAIFAALAGFTFLIVGLAAGSYRVPHTRGSFDLVVDLARTSLFTVALLVVLAMPLGIVNVPRGLPITALIVGVVFMCTVRFIVRSHRWGRTATTDQDIPVIICGAGPRGQHLTRTLVREPTGTGSRCLPVAAVDDNPLKRRLRVDRVHVRGRGVQLANVATQAGAKTALGSTPYLTGSESTRIHALAREAGLKQLMLPAVADILEPTGSDLRKLQTEDLLGRPKVSLDASVTTEATSGKRVLVTCAGRSIGSELYSHISKFGPAKLVLLGRDQSTIHAAQLSMTGRALLDDGALALADIRDPEQLQRIFERERPQVAFHTAALKHLTPLEQFPPEAWKTT